jgi:7-carboxy-7-deazaguanine synthase
VRIAELYQSVQGEGLLTGTPSVFVRASGCNLRCWFCDTPYTSWSPEGEEQSVEQIVSETLALACRHVVITGGEPLLFAEMVELCQQLRSAERHITIETAGTLLLNVECDLMSISPKLANSTPSLERSVEWHTRHERVRHQPQVVRELIARYPYQLKFVIDHPKDCDEVERYLEEVPAVDRSRVLLMPQGTDLESLTQTAIWLEPLCVARGWRFCPRKHVEWYGFRRGT